LGVERELNERNLYAVRDQSFDWWEGEKPLSLAAYDVRTADDLKDYVDRERDQVAVLAQQADPLVKFLQGRSGTLGPQETQALSDWRTISQELKRYSDKVPGNSVSLLEDFIRTGMDKIAPETSCQDSSTRDPAGRADYFLARRTLLRTGTLARCRVLTQPIYSTQIATLFNRRLAERFPFSTTAPQSRLQEADPAALVEFYGKLDQYSKAATDGLNQNPQLGKSRDAALVFLSQMAAIRPVFAAFLMGADKTPAPSFDFVVNFRVNRNKEIGGDQIFDWGLDVGQQSFQNRAKENTGRWRLGDPIRVTLRFAADSPVLPLPDNSQPAMSVRQRTVTFEYTGAWSLFQLLLDHKGGLADFKSGVDPMPHTLSFNIGTTPDLTLPQRQGAPGQVRVYLQLTVVPTGAKDAVAVPLPFPVRAPVLSETNYAQR
jgi:type VI secretion system protein ImpL